MIMKELVEKESSDKSPLLMNGEDSSPSCFRMNLGKGDTLGENRCRFQQFGEATLSVHLVDDATIGYFRNGEFIDYTNAGAKIELTKESAHLPEPEIEIFDSVGYSEEVVAPFRNENGKISPQGLKSLGEMAVREYMAEAQANI